MRLDHYLSAAGLGSRSDVKKIISKGCISVEGSVVRDPGYKLDENIASVIYDGNPLVYRHFVYFMLNKPQGVISASRRDLKKPDEVCVTDLIKEEKHRELFPIGRLDKDTEGLLLITDDGKLAHDLLSPKKHVDKTYYVILKKELTGEDRIHIEKGVDIGDEKITLPAHIDMIDDISLHITIHEGRYHQIKRMFESVGNKVVFLKRISMGTLNLDSSLEPGKYRELTPEELSSLNR